MASKTNIIFKKLKRYLKVLKDHDYNIRKMYVYGSYSRGNYRKDSDIDVLIISDDFTGNRFEDSLKLMILCRDIDSRIEPMPYRSQDFNDSDPLVVEVKATGKEIKI